MIHGPTKTNKQTNQKSPTTIYNTTTAPTIAPTTTLAAKANNPDPDLATAGAAAEEAPLVEAAAVAPEVELEPELDERALVDVTEAVAVLGYRSELLYVVQELVAGVVGSPPGSFWFSPRQTENSFG